MDKNIVAVTFHKTENQHKHSLAIESSSDSIHHRFESLCQTMGGCTTASAGFCRTSHSHLYTHETKPLFPSFAAGAFHDQTLRWFFHKAEKTEAPLWLTWIERGLSLFRVAVGAGALRSLERGGLLACPCYLSKWITDNWCTINQISSQNFPHICEDSFMRKRLNL